MHNRNINKNLQLFIALICGTIGTLSFAPYNFWPSSIISITGLLILINNKNYVQVIRNTLFWGIGFFSAGLYWIQIGISRFINLWIGINIILIILLILYLTFFLILFSISLTILRSIISKWAITIITPILWLISDNLRSNTIIGFPWLLFGYTQIDGPIKGLAPITGVDGITFILVLISSLLAQSIKTIHPLPFIASLIIFILSHLLTKIQWYHITPKYTTNVSLVQGNIDQHLIWDHSSIQSTLQIYLNNTLPLLGKTKIIVWPESAIPGHEINHNQFLVELDNKLRKNKTCLITGIISSQFNNNNNYNYYNSIIVLGNTEPYTYTNINRYNKHHLVLFAEQLPYQSFFEPILHYFDIPIIFMKRGLYLQPPLYASNIKITAAICYEIVLGNQIRDNFKSDSNLLLIISNDVWFGDSIGPWQHFQMVRMRALELGRPILCCTNNGITAFINADGSIQSQLPQFICAVLTANIVPTAGITPYAKFGSIWFFILILIFIIYHILYHHVFKRLLLK